MQPALEEPFPPLWSLTLVARTWCFCCCNTLVWSRQIPLKRTSYLITSQFETFTSHLLSLLPHTKKEKKKNTRSSECRCLRRVCGSQAVLRDLAPSLCSEPFAADCAMDSRDDEGITALARLTDTLVRGSCLLATALAGQETERFPAV